MLSFASCFLVSTLLLGIARAAPVQIDRRIDQTISDSTKDWETACIKAGGTRDKCSNVAVTAFSALQEAAGVCAQQDGADSMIDLAKQFNSDPDMIRLAQIFVQQPRNSPEKKQIPYCQVAPKNPELNGLFHCQFAGSDFTSFEGDQTGNVPLGLTSLSPPGSCPAKPDGPVPDGVQLNTLVTEPVAATATLSSTGTNGTAKQATDSVVSAVPSSSSTTFVLPGSGLSSSTVPSPSSTAFLLPGAGFSSSSCSSPAE